MSSVLHTLRQKLKKARDDMMFARIFEKVSRDPAERLEYSKKAAMFEAEFEDLRRMCPELSSDPNTYLDFELEVPILIYNDKDPEEPRDGSWLS